MEVLYKVLVEPFVGGGSVVWVANPPDEAWLQETYDAERATARLDQRDGGAELAVHVENEAAHVLLLLEIHAGHRLVEQQ